jgi:hypothetical protein
MTRLKNIHLKSGAIYGSAQYVSIIKEKKKGLSYNVNEMMHKDFFLLKAPSGSITSHLKNN